ncbi:MAG: alpha/beta fold hydrolase [Bacteroidetes bacterium]|nr:alpha/beta fold hydrolase [Bacteroidota bacterium]
MELNYKTFGQGDPVIILHGLFGTLDNWQTIARQLAENYSVFILDQRNHGRSPHAEPHDYPTLAEDLRQFMEAHWMYDGAHVIGHSMGGKTAMQFALNYPDLVKKLVVVDIAPKAYQGNHYEIFEALKAMDLDKIADRKEAEAFLAERIQEEDVRLFLMKNLTRKTPFSGEQGGSGGFEFKMNLPVLWEHYPTILAEISGEPFEGPTLFIRGGRSKHVVLPEDESLIKKLFPNSEIKTVEGAGHWVHAEKPGELLKMVQVFLGE